MIQREKAAIHPPGSLLFFDKFRLVVDKPSRFIHSEIAGFVFVQDNLPTVCSHDTHMMSTWAVDIGTIVRSQSACYNGHISVEGGTNVKYLSDELLLEVYQRAVGLQLDAAFIDLLCEEIKRRNLIDSVTKPLKLVERHTA